MTEYRLKMEQMEIGEVLKFPKEMRKKINGAASRMYCHGKTLIVKSERKNDYLTVTRVE